MCIIEVDKSDRIIRVITGERPDWLKSAKDLKSPEASDMAALKHKCEKADLQICHVLAWTVLAKYVRRKFKGMSLEEAHSWLSEERNWPAGVINENLLRKSKTRAVSSSQLVKLTPSKESIEEFLGAYISELNSWAGNLWAGPKSRNEAKGRLLSGCMNIVKRSALKTPQIYVGRQGKVSCFSGDKRVEMTIQRWELHQDATISPVDKVPYVRSDELVVGDLAETHNDGGRVIAIVIRAAIRHQKLKIRGNLHIHDDYSGGLLLFNNWVYYRVSQQFDITSWLNMRKSMATLNEDFFSKDGPIKINNFNHLGELLTFSSIDLEHADEELNSKLCEIFNESYGPYLSRLSIN